MESNLKRRTFIANVGIFSATTLFAERWAPSSSVYPGNASGPAVFENGNKLRPFTVALPSHTETLPYQSNLASSKPAFSLRGIKGWAWSPEQYLDEIPIMVKYRLNFLMNDYGSLWDLGPHGTEAKGKDLNFWYRPLPASMKQAFGKVIRSCQQHGIDFCFSVNPNVRSDKPFDYDNSDDFEALWQHYAWSQNLGVKWFNVSLDDIHKKIDAAGQARLANKLFQRLRQRDPAAQLAFCPTWYAGTGDTGVETNTTLGAGDTPGTRYTRILGEKLHPDIFLFWTGPDVCSLTISAEHASRYKALSRHRILVWDNYPVNDQQPALHLGPLTGRSSDLNQVVDGYISNSMAYENEANRIPMLTIADYLWNPKKYEPGRSIGQAIM
ncbi:MAG: beta-N-acetylglucosaminidase domain-containing protein, partial [Acidobacteriaceae bacterium]